MTLSFYQPQKELKNTTNYLTDFFLETEDRFRFFFLPILASTALFVWSTIEDKASSIESFVMALFNSLLTFKVVSV